MIGCVCGRSEFYRVDRPNGWSVTETGSLKAKELEFVACSNCGIVRQINLPFSDEDSYIRYYEHYPPTSEGYAAKDWDHDFTIAQTRLESYHLPSGQKTLDVGSGSGAFVKTCRDAGHEAYGNEIAHYSYSRCGDYVYPKSLEKIHFPTDHFDLVTAHDVLEHVLDPGAMLREMFRVVKEGGRAVFELPRFFHPSGQHHWKEAEHIWCFDEPEFSRLLTSVGFQVTEVQNPVESKTAFFCVKPKQLRNTIMVPPGIGDLYWVMAKMQAFIDSRDLGIPDIHLMCPLKMAYEQHARSLPFIDMFPFVHNTNHIVTEGPFTQRSPLWHEAYAVQGRTIFENIPGYNYAICYNGHLRVGKPLEYIDPHLKTNWYPPMFVSLEQDRYKEDCRRQFGDYVVYHWIFRGTFKRWMSEFSVAHIVAASNIVARQTGCTSVFAGAAWDQFLDGELHQTIKSIPRSQDLLGRTTVDQLFGLLRGARAVVGYPSGLTIMAAVFGVPTIMLWHDYYNRDFSWYCVPPDVRRRNYFVERTYGLNYEKFGQEITELFNKGTIADESQYAHDDISPPSRSGVTERREQPAIPKVQPPSIQTPILRTSKRSPTLGDNSDVVVLCVWKSGGDYTLEYVQRLKNMVMRNSTQNPRFICLTNENISSDVCETRPLMANLDGWWSKLELFRGDMSFGRVVYLDLDTVIIRNIDQLLNLDVNFAGLRDWGSEPKGMNSSIMAWKPSLGLSFLFERFDPNHTPRDPAHHWNNGDQYYISTALQQQGIPYESIQDLVPGVYSYKKHCRTELPPDARVVCFHGRPRPHEALGTKWVRNYWR